MNFLILHWAIVDDEHWEPGIGDPSLMGWFTVLAYIITSIICLLCGLQTSRFSHKISRYRWFWWGLALLLLLLGINKQLDLQSWLTVVGKKMALSQGWYERRRVIQVAFIAAIVTTIISWLMLLGQIMGNDWKKFKLALFGLIFLISFVLIRASSFHHIDQLISFSFGGFKMNWLLELSGIICIGVSALKHINQLKQLEVIHNNKR